MKRRIGTIYNKPIIEGDINLKTTTEIHKNELQGGGNNVESPNTIKYIPKYYKIDWDSANDTWELVFSEEGKGAAMYSTVKLKMREGMYAIHKQNVTSYIDVVSFSYLPVYSPVQPNLDTGGVINEGKFCISLEDAIELVNTMLLAESGGSVSPLSMEGISEISEEEYYKV